MKHAPTYAGVSSCDGCKRRVFALRTVDGAKLCDGCDQKSVEIDRQLAHVRSSDPVECDEGEGEGEGEGAVDFDARIAVVVRACGGAVLCDQCKPTELEREVS